MDESRQDTTPLGSTREPQDRPSRYCLAALVLLWLVVLTVGIRAGSTKTPGTIVDAPPGTLNPNDAAWYELSLLPHLGESKARAVVEHRESRDGGPAYVAPMDLTDVRGIGPKTVERLARELRFED